MREPEANREQALDEALEGLFDRAWALPAERQAALKRRLDAQRESEQLWVAFTGAMLQLRTQLQPATAWRGWPLAV
jgi:hypothetical protein